MGVANEDFEIESTVDLDNIDEKAAQKLLDRSLPKDDIEVVEVPDERVTPEDRKAKPLPKDVAADPTEEELASYSESVRQRIAKLTHDREDQRREKETATRERDEAVAFAQQALARHKLLEQQAQKLSEQSSSATLEKLTAELDGAKKAYIEAADSYDTAAMAEAQLKMADLVAQKRQAEAQKAARPVAQQDSDVVQPRQPTRPAPDQRAQEWVARNGAWFQKDKAMTAFAFGVHEELVSTGVDPRTDAELYYKKLDEQIKTRFPEKFEADRTKTTTPRTSPVAPASRTVSGRRRVTLTTTELSLAKRLGVTPEQFASEKLKLEQR